MKKKCNKTHFYRSHFPIQISLTTHLILWVLSMPLRYNREAIQMAHIAFPKWFYWLYLPGFSNKILHVCLIDPINMESLHPGKLWRDLDDLNLIYGTLFFYLPIRNQCGYRRESHWGHGCTRVSFANMRLLYAVTQLKTDTPSCRAHIKQRRGPKRVNVISFFRISWFITDSNKK